jgi:lipoprotein LprG
MPSRPPLSTPRRSLVIPALAVLLAGLAACSGDKDEKGDLPKGDELVSSAADAMRSVKTAHFRIESDGDIGGVPLRRADGVITAAGDAEGTARIEQGGPLSELSFVVKGQTLWVKGVTGGWQKLPLALASTVYDPSKILNPDQGIANVLATATGAKTEARETVDGADAYRVAATFKGDALSKLVPGVEGDIPGKLWIGADRHVLHRGQFTVDKTTVTVTFTDFDKPVTVNEP